MTRLDPNPPSPYATADPQYRHLFPEYPIFGAPPAGVLAVTACEGLAIVPDGPLRELDSAAPPDGLCPACLTVAAGGDAPSRPQSLPCQQCESQGPDGLCVLCRIELHETWAAQQTAADQPHGEPR